MDNEKVFKEKRKQAIKLVRAYLRLRNKPRGKRPDCDPDLYNSFFCCAYHKSLLRERGALEAIAENLLYRTDSGSEPLCGNWWVALGQLYNIAVPVSGLVETK